MRVVVLSGSNVGTKTRTAMNYTVAEIEKNYPDRTVTLLDLADYDMQFSDGRNYLTYTGDTKYIAETVMNADALIIGTPIF